MPLTVTTDTNVSSTAKNYIGYGGQMSFDSLRETAMFQQQYSKDKYIRICPSYDGYGIVVYAKNGDDSSQVSNYILTNNNIKKYAIVPWVSSRHQEMLHVWFVLLLLYQSQ